MGIRVLYKCVFPPTRTLVFLHYHSSISSQNNSSSQHTTNTSQWSPPSKPSTTSLSPSRAPPLVLPRRPTRRLPRTATPASALVPPLLRTLLATRLTRTPTTARLRPTSSTPRTKRFSVTESIAKDLRDDV